MAPALVPTIYWLHSVVKNCPDVIADIMEYVPAGAPKNPPLAACTTSTFLSVVRSKGYGNQIGAQGQPTCANGYALEVFTPYPGGQAAQFFLTSGGWQLEADRGRRCATDHRLPNHPAPSPN